MGVADGPWGSGGGLVGPGGAGSAGLPSPTPRLFQDGRIRLLHAADGHRVPGLAVERDVPRAGRAAAPQRRRVPGALGPRGAHAGTAGGLQPEGPPLAGDPAAREALRGNTWISEPRQCSAPRGGGRLLAAGHRRQDSRQKPSWPCWGSASATWPWRSVHPSCLLTLHSNLFCRGNSLLQMVSNTTRKNGITAMATTEDFIQKSVLVLNHQVLNCVCGPRSLEGIKLTTLLKKD